MEKMKMTWWARCHSSARDLRNSLRMAAWTLAWGASWAAVARGIKDEWLPTGAPTVAATLVSLGIGLGMILAYRRFLRDADELQRKIQLDALAISLGISVVGSAAYSLLESAGTVADADTANVILLVAVTYSASVMLGQWRYS